MSGQARVAQSRLAAPCEDCGCAKLCDVCCPQSEHKVKREQRMPSLFESASTDAGHSDHLRDQIDLGGDQVHAAATGRRQFARRQRLCGKTRRMSHFARRRTDRSRRCCSALRTKAASRAICSGPARCRACCRRASIALPMRRTTRAWQRLPLRSAAYRFGRYRKTEASDVRLVPPDGIDVAEIARMADGAMLARDLINTPANDMGPAELELAARAARRALRRDVSAALSATIS